MKNSPLWFTGQVPANHRGLLAFMKDWSRSGGEFDSPYWEKGLFASPVSLFWTNGVGFLIPKLFELYFLDFFAFTQKHRIFMRYFCCASFLSTHFGARAHFRTRVSGSGRPVSPKHWYDRFFKIYSRHTAMLFRRWRRYFFVFLQISVFRFCTNTIYLHQVYRFLRRLLPRSYRLPPDWVGLHSGM